MTTIMRCEWIGLVLIAVLWSVAFGQGPYFANSRVVSIVEAIEGSPPGDTRTDLAHELALYFVSLDNSEIASIEISAIHKLASLLEQDEDVIRYFAAVSLGSMGAHAKGALPKLEKALAEFDKAMMPDQVTPAESSRRAIESAIESIRSGR